MLGCCSHCACWPSGPKASVIHLHFHQILQPEADPHAQHFPQDRNCHFCLGLWSKNRRFLYVNPCGSRVKPLLVLVKYARAYLSVCVAYNSTEEISPKLLYWTLSTSEQSGEKLGQLVNRLKEKGLFLCNSRSKAQNKNHQKTKSNLSLIHI